MKFPTRTSRFLALTLTAASLAALSAWARPHRTIRIDRTALSDLIEEGAPNFSGAERKKAVDDVVDALRSRGYRLCEGGDCDSRLEIAKNLEQGTTGSIKLVVDDFGRRGEIVRHAEIVLATHELARRDKAYAKDKQALYTNAVVRHRSLARDYIQLDEQIRAQLPSAIR